MRAFLAVELPSDVRAGLEAVQRELRQAGADVKWTDAPNLHVTMRFLGEVSDAQVEQVQRLASQAAAGRGAIQARISGLGAFPSMASPRIVWAGIDQGAEALARLASALEAGCRAAGLPAEDRPIAAHVTLGRIRSPRGLSELVRALQDSRQVAPAPFTVDRVILFESRLSSAGSTYRSLATFPLAGSSGA
jgi:2'-5' RNA ligase